MKIRIVKKGIPKAQVGPPYGAIVKSQLDGIKAAGISGLQNIRSMYPDLTEKYNLDPKPEPQKFDYDFQSGLDRITKKFDPTANPFASLFQPPKQFNPATAQRMLEAKELQGRRLVDPEVGPSPFVTGMGNASMAIKAFTGAANAITDTLQDRRRQAEYRRRFNDALLNPPAMYPTSESRGDYTVNEGIFRPNQMQPPNVGMYANPYYNTMMFRKYGGQMGYGLDLNQRKIYTDMPESMAESVKETLTEDTNFKEEPWIEAEGGETAWDGMQHHKIEGNRHHEGGVKLTPSQVPKGSFIFSDTAKMRIGGDILKLFGKSSQSKRKYTPAELAKQYMNNKHIATLNDPLSDKIQLSTANQMIENNNKMLAKLALVQESKKGFRDGIPQVAIPYLQSMMVGPSEAAQSGMDQAKYGGQFYPKMVLGGDDVEINPDVDPYAGGKKKTPTGRSNQYTEKEKYLNEWEKYIPDIRKMDNKTAQGLIYDITMKENPDFVRQMWNEYGLTDLGLKIPRLLQLSAKDSKGKYTGRFDTRPEMLTAEELKLLREAFVDGEFGARQFDAPIRQVDPPSAPPTVAMPPAKEDPIVPLGVPDFTSAQRRKVPYGMTTPDKLAILAAMVKRPKKYLPYISPLNTAQLSPTFRDWRGTAAASTSMANTLARTAGAMGPAQGLAANLSFINGQIADRLNQDITNTEQYNVDLANKFNVLTTDVRNKMNQFEAERKTELYKGNVIANQNKDNADRAYAQYIARPLVHGLTQAQDLYDANQMASFFYRDPRTGRTIFKGPIGKPGDMKQFDFLPQMNSNTDDYTQLGSTYSSLVSMFYDQLKANKYLTDEDRKKEAKTLARTAITNRRTSQKNSPYGMSPSDYYRVSGYDFPDMP